MARPAPTDPSAPTSPRGGLATSLWLVAAPLFMLLLAVAFLLSSGELEGREANYPRVLAVVVIALAAVSIAQDLASGRVALAAAGTPADGLEGGRGRGLAVRRVLAFFALAVVSVWLMSWVGFFLPALLLVGAGVYVLGVRTPWKVAAYTVGLVAAAYAVFVEALQVPFPPVPWS